MTEFFDRVTESGPDLVIRATVLFGMAWGLTWCLRRGSAAQRHFVWSAALAGSLALPVLRATVPVWNVWPGSAVVRLEATTSPRDTILWGWAQTATGPSATGVSPSISPVGSPHIAPRTALLPAIPFSHWLVVLWGAGVLLCVARLGLAMSRLRTLARRAEPATGRVELLLEELARASKIRRSVRVWISREPVIPMTWGWRRPTVLLPSESAEWSVERLRVVLLHELAHVRRGDFATQLVGEIARSVYWFHPLAWWSVRCLRAEQEAACDDCVLVAGTVAEDYAEALIAVTARSHGGWAEPEWRWLWGERTGSKPVYA